MHALGERLDQVPVGGVGDIVAQPDSYIPCIVEMITVIGEQVLDTTAMKANSINVYNLEEDSW